MSLHSKRFLLYFITTLFLSTSVSSIVYAEEMIIVESVQTPAWLQVEGKRKALSPGQILKADHQVITGQTGKTILKLPEGSQIKLGNNATFNINSASNNNQSNSQIFNAAFRILKGAFRFTTSAFAPKSRRDIKISTTTATIGIRGTDLWGRVKETEDLVALLEGKISIERTNEDPIIMTEALSVYTASVNQPANPLSNVDIDTVNQLALETEHDLGNGIIVENGPYTVFVGSSKELNRAQALQQQYQDTGFPAEVIENNIDGIKWYRIGISGFKTYGDADYFSQLAADQFNAINPWINKN